MTTIYKIRHQKTNCWSRGGVFVSGDGTGGTWTEDETKAKSWNTLGKLRSHITSHMSKYNWDRGTDMSDWEVVEYQLVVKEAKPIHEVIDPRKLIKILAQ